MPTAWFVSPAGLPTNAGTLNAPWDIASALVNTAQVKPGDMIELEAGTYRSPDRSPGAKGFGVNLQGAPHLAITVAPYGQDHVVIDGGLFSNSDDRLVPNYVTFKNLEIIVSENLTQSRTSAYSGSSPPPDLLRPWGGIYFNNGSHLNILDCDIHDCMGGIGLWSGVTGTNIVSGNLLYDNGWIGSDGGHGHGLYSQNAGPGIDHLQHNLIFGNYGDTQVQLYGSSIAPVNDYDVRDNFLWGANSAVPGSGGMMLVGGKAGFRQVVVENNVGYGSNLKLGYTVPGSYATVEHNTAVRGALQILPGTTHLTASGNFSWATGAGVPTGGAVPTAPLTFLDPDPYLRNRALVGLIDWQPDTQVTVPVGSWLNAGDTYEVFDPTQLYGAPIYVGTYVGNGNISLPLSGAMQTQGPGYSVQGAVYVLERVPAGSPPTTPVVTQPVATQSVSGATAVVPPLNYAAAVDAVMSTGPVDVLTLGVATSTQANPLE